MNQVEHGQAPGALLVARRRVDVHLTARVAERLGDVADQADGAVRHVPRFREVARDVEHALHLRLVRRHVHVARIDDGDAIDDERVAPCARLDAAQRRAAPDAVLTLGHRDRRRAAASARRELPVQRVAGGGALGSGTRLPLMSPPTVTVVAFGARTRKVTRPSASNLRRHDGRPAAAAAPARAGSRGRLRRCGRRLRWLNLSHRDHAAEHSQRDHEQDSKSLHIHAPMNAHSVYNPSRRRRPTACHDDREAHQAHEGKGRITTMPRPLVALFALGLAAGSSMMALLASAAPSTPVAVALQPLAAQVARVTEALQYLGAPLPDADRRAIEAAIALPDERAAASRVQEILDRHCLLDVHINPESRVHVTQGRGERRARRAGLAHLSRQGAQRGRRDRAAAHLEPAGASCLLARARRIQHEPAAGADDLGARRRRPLARSAVCSTSHRSCRRSRGSRSSTASSSSTAATPASAKRRSRPTSGRARRTSASATTRRSSSRVLPSNEVRLRVLDERGQPTTASLVIRDAQGRVYPSQAKRLAPDFAFQPQVYRADGEIVRLPPGDYTVESPAARSTSRAACRSTSGARARPWSFRLERWIDLPARGWYLRRSSHPRGRLRALRDADRGRRAARHDAPHPRRGSERRLRADLGPVLVLPEAVLRRQGSTRSRRPIT